MCNGLSIIPVPPLHQSGMLDKGRATRQLNTCVLALVGPHCSESGRAHLQTRHCDVWKWPARTECSWKRNGGFSRSCVAVDAPLGEQDLRSPSGRKTAERNRGRCQGWKSQPERRLLVCICRLQVGRFRTSKCSFCISAPVKYRLRVKHRSFLWTILTAVQDRTDL
jgi:hypothetical protein